MNRLSRITLIVAVSSASLSGCAWVELKPQAEKVRVLVPHEVVRCRELGRISAVTPAQVGFIARDKGSVQEELYRLARNNAASMGGDSVVSVGQPADGEQAFKVYRCINP